MMCSGYYTILESVPEIEEEIRRCQPCGDKKLRRKQPPRKAKYRAQTKKRGPNITGLNVVKGGRVKGVGKLRKGCITNKFNKNQNTTRQYHQLKQQAQEQKQQGQPRDLLNKVVGSMQLRYQELHDILGQLDWPRPQLPELVKKGNAIFEQPLQQQPQQQQPQQQQPQQQQPQLRRSPRRQALQQQPHHQSQLGQFMQQQQLPQDWLYQHPIFDPHIHKRPQQLQRLNEILHQLYKVLQQLQQSLGNKPLMHLLRQEPRHQKNINQLLQLHHSLLTVLQVQLIRRARVRTLYRARRMNPVELIRNSMRLLLDPTFGG